MSCSKVKSLLDSITQQIVFRQIFTLFKQCKRRTNWIAYYVSPAARCAQSESVFSSGLTDISQLFIFSCMLCFITEVCANTPESQTCTLEFGKRVDVKLDYIPNSTWTSWNSHLTVVQFLSWCSGPCGSRLPSTLDNFRTVQLTPLRSIVQLRFDVR